MIEKFTKKRMVFAILTLITITIGVLFIESRWEGLSEKKFITESNSTCFETQNFEIISECHPCTSFEIASRSIGVCIHTHNKEVLRCKNGEIVYRSCDKVAFLEERNFWIFEVICFVLTVFSWITVYLRQKLIERRFFQRESS